MVDDNRNEAYVMRSGPDSLPPQAIDVTFLITASELRNRKTRRRRRYLLGRSETICRLIEPRLKLKRK